MEVWRTVVNLLFKLCYKCVNCGYDRSKATQNTFLGPIRVLKYGPPPPILMLHYSPSSMSGAN